MSTMVLNLENVMESEMKKMREQMSMIRLKNLGIYDKLSQREIQAIENATYFGGSSLKNLPMLLSSQNVASVMEAIDNLQNELQLWR